MTITGVGFDQTPGNNVVGVGPNMLQQVTGAAGTSLIFDVASVVAQAA